MLQVHPIPCLKDNFSFLLYDDNHPDALIIDAPEAEAIQQACEKLQKTPTHLLITHHHSDHTQGIESLVSAFSCRVIAPEQEREKIPKVNYGVSGQSYLNLINTHIKVLHTPGHTLGHVVYHFPEEGFLFSGDTLFSLGCGRALEGDCDLLYESLQKIAQLPDETQVFFGHDYTQTNLKFSLSLTESQALHEYQQELQSNPSPSSSSLKFEKAHNLFLNPQGEDIKKALQLEAGCDEKTVFATLRSHKDRYR